MAPRIALEAALSALILLTGCGDRSSAPSPASSPTRAATAATDSPAASEFDGWLGQWNGPEGTFVRLTGGQGTYVVTIQNLDGPRAFHGSADAKGIQFERDGVREWLRATDGRGTGMKWLVEKSDCLTVRPGEGYCRD